MSFSFTPTSNSAIGAAAPTAGAFGFGARPVTTTAPPPAFGATAAPAFGAAGSSPFGQAPATSAFGQAPTTSAFGQAPATSAFGQAPTSLGFAAATAAQPGFGAPTAQPGFGATTAQPGFGAPTAQSGFGAPTAQPGFGAPTAQPGFGAPTAQSGFGAPTAQPGFGAATAQPGFGAPTAQPGFGAPTAFGAATTASPFGQAAPAVVSVAPTFSFAPPATSAPTTAPPAFGFGSTATTAPATSVGLQPALTAGIGSFAFAKPQATTAASLNFSTNTTTATAQPFNTGLRLGGSTSAVGSGIFGKPPGQQTTAPATFVGLGGIDVSATQPKLGDNKKDGIKIKETQVPDEIVKTVEALKVYIKQQKTTSSDIGRTSTSKFSNVTHEITGFAWALQNMANSVDANNQQIKLLRLETAKAIQSLEMAQRTQDTPIGLQYENNAPFQYFQCLVVKYEQDLIAFRQQITLTERHMHALANPQSIAPEDLKRGLRQLNEAFISLAGRLHDLHQRVEEQKELYLNLRRYKLRDATNVFEKIDNPPPPAVEPQRISSGPTPFSNISAISSLNKSYASAAAASSSNAAAK
ncbi:nuclear pore complex protein Nup58 [Drosophila pseudoobscura]|uniref:Nuclear pore complex protein Nup58 n=1 Tax=Drosophila pseudoobscura pseudoobscura TaxID=46245 RepID=A0A6I8USD8_DROPS|nr:nuclear pore complex protein Nup58 [Drosophila pseudoobscura]